MEHKKMPGIPEAAKSEEAARAFLESTRWANGRFCPHCASVEPYKITPKKQGSKTRPGLYKCKACRKQFTVTVGTIFEGSHLPLHKWLMAVHLMTASKKGISAHQLHRMLGITYKSAWFMAHRLRYAMTQPAMKKLRGDVEVDETYIGAASRSQPRYIGAPKRKPVVLALISRKGQMRAKPIKAATAQELKGSIRQYVHKDSRIITDQWQAYRGIGKDFKRGHESVNHSKLEYVRGDVYTNTAESYFALLKRGIHGTFHHITERHLARYCDEFSFRWNHRKATDTERAVTALIGIEGKRLTYRGPTGLRA